MFWPERVLLDGCFSFKMEDLIWSCPDGLYKSYKHREQFSLKNLTALEQMHWLNLSETGSQFVCSNYFIPVWLLLSSWRQNLTHVFCIVCNLLLSFCSGLDTKLNRHIRNVVELLHCIWAFSDTAINIYFFCRVNVACYWFC